MTVKKIARHGGYHNAQCPGQADPILAEFELGAKWAALALIAMFAFLSIGCVMFAW